MHIFVEYLTIKSLLLLTELPPGSIQGGKSTGLTATSENMKYINIK